MPSPAPGTADRAVTETHCERDKYMKSKVCQVLLKAKEEKEVGVEDRERGRFDFR